VITDQGWGTNVLSGGDGNDTITFSYYANNTVDGGAGNDLIKVDNRNYGNYAYVNTFTGGTGNDRIEAAAGADTYVFNRGDGQDTISDYGNGSGGAAGNDRLVFGAGIAASDLGLSRSDYNLVVKINDPNNPAATDQIVIENWFSGDTYQIETFAFADGTSLSKVQLNEMGNVVYGTDGADTMTGWSDDNTISGLAGNDTITDSYGSDTLDGGAGDDVITDQGSGTNILRGGDGNDTITFSYYANNTVDGGAGNDLLQSSNTSVNSSAYVNTYTGGTGNDRIVSSADTYLFNRGAGQDAIFDLDNWGSNKTDTLRFGAGIAELDIILARSGNNLLISDHGTMGSVTVENWYSSSAYQVEQIALNDGTKLLNTQVDQLIQAMATFSASHGGISWDQAITQNPNEVQAVLATYWQPASG
jgi:Ca2+-binding RTX toxin-like protein